MANPRKGVTRPRRFRVGDRVRWSSSAAGTTATKNGRVVAIVGAKKSPVPKIDKLLKTEEYISRYGGGLPREEESYLVAVETGPTTKDKLYWPNANKLTSSRRRAKAKAKTTRRR